MAGKPARRRNFGPSDKATPPAPTFVGGTMLLVEDEATIRAFAATALRELGCHVLEAKEGQEGLRVLHQSLGKPGVDLLVTDVGLPGGLNGRQLAEAA